MQTSSQKIYEITFSLFAVGDDAVELSGCLKRQEPVFIILIACFYCHFMRLMRWLKKNRLVFAKMVNKIKLSILRTQVLNFQAGTFTFERENFI